MIELIYRSSWGLTAVIFLTGNSYEKRRIAPNSPNSICAYKRQADWSYL